MADRKYIQKRGDCWYVRVPKPPKAWGKKNEFVCSLSTPDLKVAQRLRNKFLLPILAETSAANMLTAVNRLLTTAQESIRGQLSDLRENLSGIEQSKLTLKQAGEDFLRYLTTSGDYAPASTRKYSTSVHSAIRILGEDADPETLMKAAVIKLRDKLLSLPVGWQRRADGPLPLPSEGKRTISARSVNDDLMVLKRMFRWLIDEGRIARKDNPFDGVTIARLKPKNHKRVPTDAEADALMDLPKPDISADTWHYMPLLARYTGCRAGEVAQLRVEDVVVEKGIRCLRITARGRDRSLKTASSERLVPVADKLAPHLDRLLAKRKSGQLLDAGDWRGDDGTVKYAHRFLKYYNQRAKAVAPDLSFHCWRVYANDAMATASVDIGDRERILGHVSGPFPILIPGVMRESVGIGLLAGPEEGAEPRPEDQPTTPRIPRVSASSIHCAAGGSYTPAATHQGRTSPLAGSGTTPDSATHPVVCR